MTRVALVTASSARHLDEDLAPLAEALERAGARPEITVWDDDRVAWQAYDVVVVRSPWDYAGRRREFVRWAERVAGCSDLRNPAPVLRWNTDKRYLADLAAAGVPVVETVWSPPGRLPELPAGEIVVKPVVGAGSVDTERYPPSRHDAAVAHLRRLHSEGRAAMVQPYLPAVEDHGETALVFFDGVFSHAVRKGPILRRDGSVFVEGLYAEEEIEARTPSDDELAIARAALRAVPAGAVTYRARRRASRPAREPGRARTGGDGALRLPGSPRRGGRSLRRRRPPTPPDGRVTGTGG